MELKSIILYILSIYAFQLNKIVPLPFFQFNKTREYRYLSVKLKNKRLAAYLEELCKEKAGFLLFSEYAEAVMYGKYGFYDIHHKRFGKTDTHNIWPKAINNLCKQDRYVHLFEFGPGDGSLGVNILMHNPSLSWTGIEINEDLHKIIKKKFRSKALPIPLVTTHSKRKKFPPSSLAIMSYYLDSVGPEIFINTKREKDFPDTIIGLVIKDGMLKEIPLSSQQLASKRITLKNGIVKKNLATFNITKWKLFSMQRAYISINAFTSLLEVSNSLNNSSAMLIVDELHPPQSANSVNHLLLPRNLDTFNRDCLNTENTYRNAGDIFYYFPMYFYTLKSLLSQLGFQSITHDSEKNFIAHLENKNSEQVSRYVTTAILAKHKNNPASKNTIKLDF